jgi:hypothetical protein
MTVCPLRRSGFWAAVVAALLLAGAAAAADAVPAPLLAQMDALWEQREARDVIPELVALGVQGLQAAPDSYEVEWRLSRAYFWVAYGQSSRVARKAMAGQAADWAARARAREPGRVEGHYFYAVAIGAYADCIGAVQAVVEGVVTKFEGAAERAYEIDRNYEHGAPITVLGRYYYVLPWPKRDLGRSRRYLEEAVTRHPSALIAHVYLADTYYDLDEPEKARNELERALDGDAPPGIEYDRQSPRAMARAALQRWFPDAVAAQADRQQTVK